MKLRTSSCGAYKARLGDLPEFLFDAALRAAKCRGKSHATALQTAFTITMGAHTIPPSNSAVLYCRRDRVPSVYRGERKKERRKERKGKGRKGKKPCGISPLPCTPYPDVNPPFCWLGLQYLEISKAAQKKVGPKPPLSSTPNPSTFREPKEK